MRLLPSKTPLGLCAHFHIVQESSCKPPLLSFPSPQRSETGFSDEKRVVEPSREEDPGPGGPQPTNKKPSLERNDPMHFHRSELLPTQTDMSDCFFLYYALTSKQRQLNHKNNSNRADPAGTKFFTFRSAETLPDTTLSGRRDAM